MRKFTRNLFIFLLFISIKQYFLFGQEDGTVCFNKCNSHGKCVDYSCICNIGWTGDDCSTTFITENDNDEKSATIIPILGAGHINITSTTFQSIITKNKLVLIGFSSPNCHKCIAAESEYQKISEYLKEKQILFGRGNVDNMKSIAAKYFINKLPALIFFHKGKPHTYKGVPSFEAISDYITKITSLSSMTILHSIEEVDHFLKLNRQQYLNINTINVIGFFSDYLSIEEDEYEEYKEVTLALQMNEDVYFGIVKNKTISTYYIESKLIDRTPSLLLINQEGRQHHINMNELDVDMGIKEWIESKAVPLVGALDGQNFLLYEKIGLPMLLLFLDLTHQDSSSQPGIIIGGKTGGILNEVLLEEFRLTAKEHQGRISFVYLDGNLYEDKMKSLGLLGGIERLPSLAFNTKESLQITFPESLPINFDTLHRFCADFINGKLRSKAEAKKFAERALQASDISTRNKVERKPKKKAPAMEKGIAEGYDFEFDQKHLVAVVAPNNFSAIVLEEGVDVLLMLYAEACEPCAHFAVYFKRAAERFSDLNISSLRIARMDVTRNTPPPHLNLLGAGALPTVVLLPAYAKHEPWSFFSGVGKPQELMKWVQKQAGIPFELPNLPHLTEEQRVLYKQQIREREEYLDAQQAVPQQALGMQEVEEEVGEVVTSRQAAKSKKRRRKAAHADNSRNAEEF